MFHTKKFLKIIHFVDVTFELAHTSTGNLQETKIYSSTKLTLLGYKVKVFVLANDRTIEASKKVLKRIAHINILFGRTD